MTGTLWRPSMRKQRPIVSKIRHFLTLGLWTLSVLFAGCTAGSIQTEQAAATQAPHATSTMLPSPTVTGTATPTAPPTPIFTLDLSAYDPDINLPVVVEHEQPPLIARSDETVLLAFWLANAIYCERLQRDCRMEPLLYYAYREDESFQSVPLVKEVLNGLDEWVTRLPATDETGKPLRYYAEFSFSEAGYSQRYPTTGTIDLFTATKLVSVELPAEQALEPGDKVYNFYWGLGLDTVRTMNLAAMRVGPPAMAVAGDGRIALLNPVNEQVLMYDPSQETYSNFSLPFSYSVDADLAFDQDGQLVVCDSQQAGMTIPEQLPHCYRLSPDGELLVSAPVYAHFPVQLTQALQVLDRYDYRLVTPFTGDQVNSRKAQRDRQTWKLPCRMVIGTDGAFDWHRARFADVETGLAYEVHSDSGLGAIAAFEKTPQGYLMAFNSGAEQVRAIWIDPAGLILKDVTLPNGMYSVLSASGQMAVAQDGSFYLMSSTKNGIEVHFAAAPEP